MTHPRHLTALQGDVDAAVAAAKAKPVSTGTASEILAAEQAIANDAVNTVRNGSKGRFVDAGVEGWIRSLVKLARGV